MNVVDLCKKYRHEGVVAIDLAGDESKNCESNPEHRMAYEVHNTQTALPQSLSQSAVRQHR